MIGRSLGTARLIALFMATAAAAAPSLPPLSPSPPVFEPRPFGPAPPPTPPQPTVVRNVSPNPLPRKWIVGAGALATVAGGALLFFGIRVWRTSRLFGRQYRFPVPDEVALRLGGERSGGLLATARFGENDAGSVSKPKDR